MAATLSRANQYKKASLLSQRALSTATAQIGRGEEGGNNKGPWIETYRMDKVAEPWCAALMSWCYHKAWVGLHGYDTILGAPRGLRRACPLKWSLGARRLCEPLQPVFEPLPGDLVLWERNGPGGDAHVGMLLYHTLPDDNLFGSIEGNKGTYPSKVRIFTHEFGEGNLLGFYRVPYNGTIEKWIK